MGTHLCGSRTQQGHDPSIPGLGTATALISQADHPWSDPWTLVLGMKPEEPGDAGTLLTLAMLNQATHLLTVKHVKHEKKKVKHGNM